MLNQASENDALRSHQLYQVSEPYEAMSLPVSGGHEIYLEQSGNPNGEPVVVFHGGPGGGCSPAMRRFFDPEHYRIILFDQRGCGRSTPFASVENNTTWDLISDIEHIRKKLGIQKWIVFGGSWGATLALLYAQSHPDAVKTLVLRGIFALTQSEIDWFYGGGAGKFWPEAWEAFLSHIPKEEHDDLVKAYHKRLFSDAGDKENTLARAWTRWENTLASMESNGIGQDAPPHYARCFARIENHYFYNKGFLPHDGYIFDNLDKIAHIPCKIVQGRFDMICPPTTAYSLHQNLNNSVLHLVYGGHAMSEPSVAKELVSIMNALKYDQTE